MKRPNITGNRRQYNLKDLKFHYDKANDLLYAYKEDSQVYSTVVIGEFHLEIDRKMGLVGLEVLNASDILREFGMTRTKL